MACVGEDGPCACSVVLLTRGARVHVSGQLPERFSAVCTRGSGITGSLHSGPRGLEPGHQPSPPAHHTPCLVFLIPSHP